MPPFKPMPAGSVFGRLTVIRDREVGEKKAPCRCTCGTETQVIPKNLINGNTRSCGCLQRDRTSESSRIHGHSHTTPYYVWRGILDRCYRRTNSKFHAYGGRGITVCDRWLAYENFHADMWPRPEGRSIDRIDNAGPYSPANCRWATAEEQMANRRPRNEWRSDGIGANNPRAKLTPDDVRAIRARYATGGISMCALGRAYSVSDFAIRRVLDGTGWRNVAQDRPVRRSPVPGSG